MIGKENMNNVSKFRLKQECLRQLPQRMINTVKEKIEAQVDGGSTFHTWNNIKYVYDFSPTRGNILQVTGDRSIEGYEYSNRKTIR